MKTNKSSKILDLACNFLIMLVLLLSELGKYIYKQTQSNLMRIFGPKYSYQHARGFQIVRNAPRPRRFNAKSASIIIALVVLTNIVTFHLSGSEVAAPAVEAVERLFLLDEASVHVQDVDLFEQKVRQVSNSLDIPPEWLMAVMYSESKINPAAVNHRGSGATGLIQFMVPTVKELNVRLGTKYYMSDIRSMAGYEQMDLVHAYLQQVRERYGEYDSLTELYLAILFPKALDQEACYVMYAKPSKTYQMNRGLDEDKDGRVTVSDIDKRMKRLFRKAYVAEKSSNNVEPSWSF